MKHLSQFGIILVITFLGEIIHSIIPLPIPASIYGLIIMLICLCTGFVKVEKVKHAGGFLIETMPLMFIPAAAGLLTVWDELKGVWFPVIAITVLTTVIVMAVTGRTVQVFMKKNAGDKN